jgi:non-ribosomal peptide synthetase component F
LQRRGKVDGSAPAYVIYTSGSTGKPKGILIDQRSICHFLRSENDVLGVRATTGLPGLFGRLRHVLRGDLDFLPGRRHALARPQGTAGDPEALPRLLSENGVTVLHAVPTLLALFAEDVPGLRIINLGGEMCPETVVERFSKPGRQMFNTYGPTEATVSASLARLEPGKLITIGIRCRTTACWSSLPTRTRACRSCRAATRASCASSAPACRAATSAAPT